jgi:hypothetical protein
VSVQAGPEAAVSEIVQREAGALPEEASLLERQLTETTLPRELEGWFDAFVGGADVSFEFDAAAHFDGMKGPHGDED